MILAESFQKNWIYTHRERKGFDKINPPLVEKMIHAFALVEALAASGLDFVFKGGTSLILLIESPGRFSIDVDIITQAGREEIETRLTNICDNNPFISYKLNEHRSYKSGVPKAHYSLFYLSSLTGKEDNILLDILFETSIYPELIEKTISNDWIKTDQKFIPVKIPTIESITGDKLTAFAPNTTGVPYNKGKELEIVKQLFDLGRLFDKVKNFEIVSKAFDKTVEKEIVYRGEVCNREGVLNDIIQTGLLIAKRERNKGEPYSSNFKEIKRGLLQFKQYQMNSFFRIDEASLASAKSIYLATKIKSGSSDNLEVFQPGTPKQQFLIQNPEYNFLNKLRAEALFYWSKALKTIGEI